jgi:hypothetical protein
MVSRLPPEIRAELENHLEEHLDGLSQIPMPRALCLLGQQDANGFCCEVAGLVVWHRVFVDRRKTLVTQVMVMRSFESDADEGAQCA